jgi:hypothetical protein
VHQLLTTARITIEPGCAGLDGGGLNRIAQGLVLIIQAVPLSVCHPEFPFQTFGWSLVVQGWASYMNDVVTWGMHTSYWKPFDKVLASINTITSGVLVGHQHLGFASFPPVRVA